MSSLAPLAPTYAHGDPTAQLASREAAALAAAASVSVQPNVFTDAQIEEYKEQDRYLPIANVGRIMKAALPENAKIAKEAKECVQECVSEFISFLSSEAAEKVLNDKRKTINGEDILYGMTSLGFDNYAEACKVYLAKYRSRQLVQEPISHRTSTSMALPSHQPSPDTSASNSNSNGNGAERERERDHEQDQEIQDHPDADETGGKGKPKGRKRTGEGEGEGGGDDVQGKKRRLVQPVQMQPPPPPQQQARTGGDA